MIKLDLGKEGKGSSGVTLGTSGSSLKNRDKPGTEEPGAGGRA